MPVGWTCSKCTYVHHAPGQRCVMCGELRVSRQQMRDFVLGKPISDRNGASTVAAAPAAATSRNNTKLAAAATHQSCFDSSKSSRPTISNPYAKSSASVLQRMHSSSTSSDVPKASEETDPVPTHDSRDQSESEPSNAPRQGPVPVPTTDDCPINAFARMTAASANQSKIAASRPDESTSAARQGPRVTAAASNQSKVAAARQPSQKQTKIALPIPATTRPVFSPGPVPFDEQAAQHWIYPRHDNFPIRQYQLEMTETALFHNTLVSLPTGLGKTLIASVVLYNFQRWFPTGLVLFLAPTLPLVNQQVQACGEIMNIPSSITAVLTGRLSPNQREKTWSTRRVFFCTPQTVQKDLQQGICPAQRIVAVVLDEAHKSTGDYAYVKVVQLLEQACAKFRVLGLSATPGTNIKAIQQVVDALRINKIDARSEEDPTVAPYTHSRKSEIVLVPQSSTARDIEHALNDLVSPYLEKIRNAAGGIAKRLVGNASVTSYQVIMTRDDLYQRDPELFQRMQGYFHVAQTFVQLRDYLHKHGVGMVRMRLLTLQNERQRGLICSVLKEPPFQRLWGAVAKASSCEDGATQSTAVQDKLANNPKLAKLTEVLSEHFERAEACSSASTRAIVFSQFRDSVSEIVQVLKALEPLIRPRHFIGQGKGPKQTDAANSAAQQLKGMKQSEQHQVIREFRSDVHNVLVCTCIGEEGLDIGEVDLIVNFDTLRNPIRMIQRVGRTGRKREGRVVCLISEGAEEKTLSASRQSERTLIHALKNPRSFKCLPTLPLFPFQPERKELQMRLSQTFHISQVEGHSSRNKKADTDKTSKAPQSAQWRLSEVEDAQRKRLFGELADVHVKVEQEFPPALRRVFLSAKELKRSNAGSQDNCGIGRTVRLLRQFESSHHSVVAKQQNHQRAARSVALRGGDQAISLLFPLASSLDASCESIDSSLSRSTEGSLAGSATAGATHQMLLVSNGKKEPLALLASQPSACPLALTVADDERQSPESCIQTGACPPPYPPATLHETNDLPTTLNETDDSLGKGTSHHEHHKSHEARNEEIEDDVFVLLTPPDDESSSSSEDESQPANARNGVVSRFDSTAATTAALQDVPRMPKDRCVDSGVSTVNSKSQAVDIEDEFRLPSDSSSSSEDDFEPEGAVPFATSLEASAETKQEGHSVDCETSVAVVKLLMDPIEDQQRREYDLRDTQSEEDDVPSKRRAQGLLKRPEALDSARNVPLNALKKSRPLCVASPSQPIEPDHTTTATKSQRTSGVLFSLEALPDHQWGSADSQDVVLPLRRARKPTNSLVIQDTQDMLASQDSGQFNPKPAAREETTIDNTPISQANLARGASRADNPRPVLEEEIVIEDTPRSDAKASLSGSMALADTQQVEEKSISVDEIVCAVCHSGASPDDDPIILCDGPADCIPCNLAVHMLCYSVPKDLLTNETWRCDPCSFYFSGGVGRVFCYVCGRENGVLKRVDAQVWKHINCETGDLSRAPGERKRLRKKGELNAAKAKQTGTRKKRRPLDHVSPNKPEAVTAAASVATNGRYRSHRYKQFLDQEAAIDSDEDMDGDDDEEDEIAAIEEAEAMTDFINDSSQLGFSQDDLDRVDPPIANDDTMHREIDLERERSTEFATPALNRRHLRRKRDGKWSNTQASAPSSEKGLGNMHFIRSVLEHHRQGGRAEEIEEIYQQLEEEAEVPDEAQLRPQRPQPTRTVVHYKESDSSDDE